MNRDNWNRDNWNTQNNTNQMQQWNYFVIAATTFSIIAIFTITTIFLPLICGSLAVIFAVLSKGSQQRMLPGARRSFMIGIATITISIIIVASVILMYLYNPEYHEYLNNAYQQMYGITMDEYLQQINEW